MASIGLYDIDLWHRGRSYPNLELMKTFNYLQSINENVIFMRPKDNEGRFSKIIYFKDNDKTPIPKTLTVYGDKKDIYGYGFFKTISPLRPEIAITPPSYLPYDAWFNKLKNCKTYDKMKCSSYLRLETKDFTDYKPTKQTIYLADHNFLYLKDAEDFIQEYKKHQFDFTQTLTATDIQTAERFLRYSTLFNKAIIIDFRFNEEFFFDNYNENILFKNTKQDNETLDNYLARLIKMSLWYKNHKKIFWQLHSETKSELEIYIMAWIKSPITASYKDFFYNNQQALGLMESASSNIRLLLKQNPQTITRSSLDLKSNL